jgi:hypothetical protein
MNDIWWNGGVTCAQVHEKSASSIAKQPLADEFHSNFAAKKTSWT